MCFRKKNKLSDPANMWFMDLELSRRLKRDIWVKRRKKKVIQIRENITRL